MLASHRIYLATREHVVLPRRFAHFDSFIFCIRYKIVAQKTPQNVMYLISFLTLKTCRSTECNAMNGLSIRKSCSDTLELGSRNIPNWIVCFLSPFSPQHDHFAECGQIVTRNSLHELSHPTSIAITRQNGALRCANHKQRTTSSILSSRCLEVQQKRIRIRM